MILNIVIVLVGGVLGYILALVSMTRRQTPSKSEQAKKPLVKIIRPRRLEDVKIGDRIDTFYEGNTDRVCFCNVLNNSIEQRKVYVDYPFEDKIDPNKTKHEKVVLDYDSNSFADFSVLNPPIEVYVEEGEVEKKQDVLADIKNELQKYIDNNDPVSESVLKELIANLEAKDKNTKEIKK